MIPNTINVEEFAQGLSSQAAEFFDPNLPETLKKFVIQIVYEYIKIAADALSGEENSYDENQTVLVCQLVGEWMYHKGIDNYKNQIPEQYWQPIMQQIAGAIFTKAKECILENKNQDDIVTIVEQTVFDTYQNLMQQLAEQNILSKSVDEIMQQSNLNDYVEQTHQNETPEMADARDEKAMKLMSIALFFKSISPESVSKMVKMLDDTERKEILTYMNLPDLETYVDDTLYKQYLEKFNNFMPKVKAKKAKNQLFAKLSESLQNIEESEFEKILFTERKNVKNFLLNVYNGKMNQESLFSADITNAITDYTVQKANNDN